MNMSYKTPAAAFIALYIALCMPFLEDCYAQSIKSEVRVSQNYANAVNDIKCYEIAYDQNSKEFVSYYQAIRRRLIRKLRSNYNNYFKNGDVCLLFLLSSDGSLVQFGVNNANSTTDKKLIDVAVSSLKQASPFPPFPEEFSLSEMPFSIIISFKETSD